jgi:CBS domain containing-hemolysin-like protein
MTALYLAAVVPLVFLNGFFVATEFALVGVRRSRITPPPEPATAPGGGTAGEGASALPACLTVAGTAALSHLSSRVAPFFGV